MTQKSELSAVGERLFQELRLEEIRSQAPSSRVVSEAAGVLGTHLGQKRKRNEDRIAVAAVANPAGFAYQIAVVCDGVGSSARGDEAAALASAAVISKVAATTSYLHPADLLRNAVLDADDIVRDRLRGQGTTTMSVFLGSDRNDVALSNVGDSRIYSWAPGSGLIQLSEDDTLENELRHLDVKSPSILDERGLRGSLSQALGESGRSNKDLKLTVLTKHQIPPGGLILATDGIWKANESAFADVAKHCQTPIEVVRRSLALASWLGGLDNASIIAIDQSNFPNQMRNESEANSTRILVWTTETKLVLFADNAQKSKDSTRAGIADQTPEVKSKPSKPRKRTRKQKPSTRQDELALPDEPKSKLEKNKHVIDVGPDET